MESLEPQVQSQSRRRSSGYRERLAAGVQRYTPKDLQALVAFRQSMHGAASPLATPEYAQWMWEGAGAEAVGNQLWLYRHAGQVVGHQAAIPVPLDVRGRTLDAAWAIHLLVQPEHQLRGIGAILSQRCYLEHEVLLGLEVSETARRVFRRAGWIDLGTVPRFVRITHPGEALERYLGRRRWLAAATSAARLSFGALDAVIGLRAATRPLEAEEVARFDDRVDRLYARERHHYPVLARRTAARLDWRFTDYPLAFGYRRFMFSHRGVDVGWAVVRLAADEGLVVGHIVDWFCSPDWAWFLLARCTTLLERWGASIVHCLHLGSNGASALRQLGFIERDSGFPLMFRAKDLSFDLMTVLCRRDSWFLTGGDSDVDRPRDNTAYPAEPDWEPTVGSPKPAGPRRRQRTAASTPAG